MIASATHVSDTYGNLTYWKRALGLKLPSGEITYYGIESHLPFFSWYSWTGSNWQIETCVRTTHFKELTPS